jgi:tetraacyldisaccharide 4'-kinase
LPATSVSDSAPALSRSGGVRHHYLALISGRRSGLAATLQRVALSTAALPYGLIVRVRNFLFDRGWLRSHKAAVPVVSVGNLTAGGTGKTPCVEFVAGFYRGRDLRVAVLSRGYGTSSGPNDEALVLEENLPDVPHLQGADRSALAQAATEELDSEVLVLDDGFQHRRLARDLDLVLIDATRPWGYGRLLPRGLLREPIGGLRRAGVVVLTRCDQVGAPERERIRERVRRTAPRVPVAESSHRAVELQDSERTTASLERLRQGPVAAFCGLGNPDAFRRTLADLGANLCAFRTYPDHHRYNRDDVERLRVWAGALPADCTVVTTQKDLVKLRLPRLGERPLWALRVRLEVGAGREELERALLNAVATQPPQSEREDRQ